MESANVILMMKFIMYIMAMLSQAFTFCVAGQFLRDKVFLNIILIFYKNKDNHVTVLTG